MAPAPPAPHSDPLDIDNDDTNSILSESEADDIPPAPRPLSPAWISDDEPETDSDEELDLPDHHLAHDHAHYQEVLGDVGYAREFRMEAAQLRKPLRRFKFDDLN